MLFLLLFVAVVSGFTIPLIRENWTVTYPDSSTTLVSIDFFCNKTNDECPYTPPSHPSHWLQLVTPFPGTDVLTYNFSPFLTGSFLEFRDLFILVDPNPLLRQNGTFSIDSGKEWHYPLDKELNWTNLKIPFRKSSYLKLTLKVDTEVHRTMSVVVIGGIILI